MERRGLAMQVRERLVPRGARLRGPRVVERGHLIVPAIHAAAPAPHHRAPAHRAPAHRAPAHRAPAHRATAHRATAHRATAHVPAHRAATAHHATATAHHAAAPARHGRAHHARQVLMQACHLCTHLVGPACLRLHRRPHVTVAAGHVAIAVRHRHVVAIQRVRPAAGLGARRPTLRLAGTRARRRARGLGFARGCRPRRR